MSQPTTPPAFQLLDIQAIYEQEQDTCSPHRDSNTLTIRAVGGPGAGNTYLVLETARWAFDSPAELQAVLADFTQRAAGLIETELTTRGLRTDEVE